MALADVVQQVLQAARNAFALGLDRLFLGLGIECEEIARRRSGQPLFDGEPNPRPGLLVRLDGIGQADQRTRMEQVVGRGEGRHRIGAPGGIGKTLVAGLRLARERIAPQLGGLLHVLLLQLLQLLGREMQRGRRQVGQGRQPGLHRRHQALQRLQRAGPATDHLLLQLFGRLAPHPQVILCHRVSRNTRNTRWQ